MRWRCPGRTSTRGELHHGGRGGGQLHRQMERQRLVGLGLGDGSATRLCAGGVRHGPLRGGRLHHGGRGGGQPHREMERQRLVGLGLGDERHSSMRWRCAGTDLYAGGDFTTAGGVARQLHREMERERLVGPGLGDERDDYVSCAGGDAGRISTRGDTSPRRAGWRPTTSRNGTAAPGRPWARGWNNTVYALAVSGTDLYAGGDFTTAGGVAANHIAKWNGSAWSALGSGMNEHRRTRWRWRRRRSLRRGRLHHGGRGDGQPHRQMERQRLVGLGLGDEQRRLCPGGGSGTDLYAGGGFTTAGGVTANHIAKWNGSAWSALGSGMNGGVYALAVAGTRPLRGGRLHHGGRGERPTTSRNGTAAPGRPLARG